MFRTLVDFPLRGFPRFICLSPQVRATDDVVGAFIFFKLLQTLNLHNKCKPGFKMPPPLNYFWYINLILFSDCNSKLSSAMTWLSCTPKLPAGHERQQRDPCLPNAGLIPGYNTRPMALFLITTIVSTASLGLQPSSAGAGDHNLVVVTTAPRHSLRS